MQAMKNGLFVLVGMIAALFSSLSFATGLTAEQVTAMTGAFDLTQVIIGIVAIGTTAIGLYVAWKGVKFISSAIKGA